MCVCVHALHASTSIWLASLVQVEAFRISTKTLIFRTLCGIVRDLMASVDDLRDSKEANAELVTGNCLSMLFQMDVIEVCWNLHDKNQV